MSLLGRELPGIVECGLWDALRRRPAAPTAALLTDIGNDLLYGFPVVDIADWVERCLDRLQKAGARVVMTRLPLERLHTLPQAKFFLLRTLFFPGSRLRLVTVRERALDLDLRLSALARNRGVSLVEHNADWYGFDPIHIKMRHWAQAWRTMLAPWTPDTAIPELAPPSFHRWLAVRFLPPEVRWFFGYEQRRAQPSGRLAGGTVLSFY
jgi:hypothetical protein